MVFIINYQMSSGKYVLKNKFHIEILTFKIMPTKIQNSVL